MVLDVTRERLDGATLRQLFSAGVSWLSLHVEDINRHNVFPVPDGDTGTNMLLTVQKAAEFASRLDDLSIAAVGDALANGALRGARGNSGTILSMLMRGFADGLAGHEHMDALSFANATGAAVRYAYDTVASVMEPVEGTILTVARVASEAVMAQVAHERDLKYLLDVMLDAAEVALQQTPELLPVLREAGVVDSGGAGLVTILRGIQRFAEGKSVGADVQHGLTKNVSENGVKSVDREYISRHHDDHGYDVQFLMIGDHMDIGVVRRDISEMGWSPLIVGDEKLIKVHIHVKNPAVPLNYAIQSGVQLDDVVVENMQLQAERYHRQVKPRADEKQASTTIIAAPTAIAVVAVARGEGWHELLRNFGAKHIVDGGPMMNPSAGDFLEAVRNIEAKEIILLPNNPNIRMAAEQAVRLSSEKTLHVVPTRTLPQGLAALLAFGDAGTERPLKDVLEVMEHAGDHPVTLEITRATRDAHLQSLDIKSDDYLALVDHELVATGPDLFKVVQEGLDQIDIAGLELATVYTGEDVSDEMVTELVAHLKRHWPSVTTELLHGGQPLYPFIISLE